MIKVIIDNHFVKYYDYYKSVCKKKYSGRYVADDLLHEVYLAFFKVNPEVIIKFNDVNKLQNIGGKIIISLFNKRNQGTKNKGKTTSPLHETPVNDINDIRSPKECNLLEIESNDDYIDYLLFNDNIFMEKEKERQRIKEIHLSNAQSVINQRLRDKETWFATEVFLQCQDKSILRLSKETRINRSYLTKAYDNGKEMLKSDLEAITKENKTA